MLDFDVVTWFVCTSIHPNDRVLDKQTKPIVFPVCPFWSFAKDAPVTLSTLMSALTWLMDGPVIGKPLIHPMPLSPKYPHSPFKVRVDKYWPVIRKPLTHPMPLSPKYPHSPFRVRVDKYWPVIGKPLIYPMPLSPKYPHSPFKVRVDKYCPLILTHL
jgi:hypothetical protein